MGARDYEELLRTIVDEWVNRREWGGAAVAEALREIAEEIDEKGE